MRDLKKKYNGIHLIGDLSECSIDDFLTEKSELIKLQKKIEKLITVSGLEVLGSYFHFFSKNAITGVIALAESHVTFHTWPEQSYVSIDIFVCNYSRDNSASAHELFDVLSKDICKSKKIKKQLINR
jgi:S-adenosylmethionine decarboxylase